jgi:hypothetical protein
VALAELAARQHGVVAFSQMQSLGLRRGAIERRAASGRLHRLHRGVYAVGHANLSADGRRLAVVLACGPGAALSHRSAAAMWGIRRGTEARWEVSTDQRGRKAPANTILHRVRKRFEVTEVRAIPVTTLARTLLDLADVLPAQALARAVHEAEVLRLLDMREVEAELATANGRRGPRKLAAAIETPSPGITRSVLEERFADLIATSGLPRPRLNAHVEANGRLYEVDALWPNEKVIVELDGAAHQTRRAFHADRARDAALAAEGHVVIRLTWNRIANTPAEVHRELRQTLNRRKRPPIPPP